MFVYFQKSLGPVLKTLRDPPDVLKSYENDYGYLGKVLHAAVVKARQTATPTQPASTNSRSLINVPSTQVSVYWLS